MVRQVPWPFPDGTFPRHPGAVVQQTVIDGFMPALVVIHTDDNGWLIGDDVNDPNQPGAVVATHIWHAIEQNSSIETLADLPPGYQARRRWAGDPWVVEGGVSRLEQGRRSPSTASRVPTGLTSHSAQLRVAQ
jgi:hypothetical protein